jgi:crotonobetainyl-CoA:carnitine CoA-transferase CaiB-like acyl-CoA transferase
MISQVTIFQEYQNNKPFAIECKYVIPMIDSACVSGFEAFINDKHIKETNYIVEQPQFRGTSAKTVRPPIRMNQTPPTIRRGAPALGEHTQEILQGLLGMSDGKIDELINAGAVSKTKEQ